MEKGTGTARYQDGRNSCLLIQLARTGKKRRDRLFVRADYFCINASLTIKFVADVSSSSRNRRLPASMPSTIPAACDVLPLASSVEK